MFEKSAHFYDLIYRWKDYTAESEQVHQLIQQHKRSAGRALLDVACGTGGHIPYLREHYVVEGLDLDEKMLKVARERHPDLTFHHGDMRSFDLGRRYDAVVCLFSSIAYVRTLDNLHRAMRAFYEHLEPGGVALVEGFIQPEKWRPHHVGALFVDEPELKIARMNVSQRDGSLLDIDFSYLVGTPEGISHFTERHEMALFSDDDYTGAMRSAGFEVIAHEVQLMQDRGLFLGRRPSD